MSKPAQTPQLFTEDYLRKLAEDKNNLVYHYEYDQPQHKFSAREREQAIAGIRAAYQNWRVRNQAEYDALDSKAQATLEAMFDLKERSGSNPVDKDEEKKYKMQIAEVKSRLHELDGAGRKQIIESDELYKRFATDHEKVVYTLTSHTTSEDHVRHLRYMTYLQVEQEKGNIDAMSAHAMVQEYLVQQFKTNQTLDQYKKEMAEKDKKEEKAKKEKEEKAKKEKEEETKKNNASANLFMIGKNKS